jgi:hypothetical protein
MIAFAKPELVSAADNDVPEWHATFLAMLPAIRRFAWRAFHELSPQSRRDAVDEVVANALVAFARLVELEKTEMAYATPLASYAVKQVREGRQVGCRLNVRDVMSRYAQRQKGFNVGHLDRFDPEQNCWREILVEDQRATPADTAASRIDFAAWLRTLPGRHRKIAKVLATNETTLATAKRFGLSPTRISQIRHELYDAWREFQGEATFVGQAAPA